MVRLLQNGVPGRPFRVVGIVDDDLYKRDARIHGVPVLGDRTHIPALVRVHDVGLIVYAIHNIAPAEQEAILDICRATPARVVLVPDLIGLLGRLARPRAADGPGLSPAALPPLVVAAADGDYVELSAVNRWLRDLSALANAGRTADVARRLAELQASLAGNGHQPAAAGPAASPAPGAPP